MNTDKQIEKAMLRDNESQLIHEVAERFNPELFFKHNPLGDLRWKDTRERVTEKEHAHIIQLAEGKLSEDEGGEYAERLQNITQDDLINSESNHWLRFKFCTATTTQRATALLSLEK